VLLDQLRELAARHPRYGYRRISVLLRRTVPVNEKRVRRLWRQQRLQVQRVRRRRLHPARPARMAAAYPGHIWAYDFVEDALVDGTPLRILTVMDEFTREGLALDVALSTSVERVIGVLTALIAQYGTPANLRSDSNHKETKARGRAPQYGRTVEVYEELIAQLRFHQPRAILLDDAHHLTYTARRAVLATYIGVIRDMAAATGIKHILVGTYHWIQQSTVAALRDNHSTLTPPYLERYALPAHARAVLKSEIAYGEAWWTAEDSLREAVRSESVAKKTVQKAPQHVPYPDTP
jgi:HTH-like domain